MENTISVQSHPLGRNSATEKVVLGCRQVYRIRNQSKNMQIYGVKGTLYITLPDDPEDYFLQPGEQLAVRTRGLVLVQGISEGAFWYSSY